VGWRVRLLLVVLLTLSTGGILELLCPEPCSLSESASSPSDGACPATCLRCHCGRPFDVPFSQMVHAAAAAGSDWLLPSAFVPQPVPRDILHIPKLARG
jgi:hypothetical protein